MTQHVLSLTAVPGAKAFTGPITVKGKATVGGRAVVREARPAAVTWAPPEANTTRTGRLTRELILCVRPDAPDRFHLSADSIQLQAAPGGQVTFKAKVRRLWNNFTAPIAVTVRNLPATITVGANNQPVTIAEGKDEEAVTLNLKPGTPPGEYHLVLQGVASFPVGEPAAGARRPPNTTVLQTSAPILLTIDTR